jgi:hypothetical protein
MRYLLERAVTCVTASSIWTVDGEGHYRRDPRGVRQVTPCMDAGLEYGAWLPYRQAWFETDVVDPSALRLGLMPEMRPAAALGVVSGVILWSNFSVTPDGELSARGGASAWFPPSPVPMDHDLEPGELPFTAFGQFGPERMDMRVFDQDVYWMDRSGRGHRIEAMPLAYVENVVGMLTERAEELHQVTVARHILQSWGERLSGRVSGEDLLEGLGVGTVALVTADVWLESTPLMRRLRRRLTDGA